jgi:hypothetical protein
MRGDILLDWDPESTQGIYSSATSDHLDHNEKSHLLSRERNKKGTMLRIKNQLPLNC